ncbi:toll-like receptor 8 [Nephila pilipes]|uniref:Toll-like receptor 8 n=1 Tax=Nephila pilipes TaxID=299642 RepID=A0A8X6PYV9_NEPPI|nr:toll-like receptor 8 [Nephila pilipes]
MQNYKFASFNVEKSNIGILPADAFARVQIQYLNILFTNLTRLSDDLNRPPFLGLESSVEGIEIRDGFATDEFPLVRLSLSHLKKLTLLQLEGNVMPTIGNDWFESGPYGLRELYLLDTYTKKLGSHAFSSLGELRKLSLTGGSISEITRDMFPSPAIYLESLDLNNNKLSILPKDIFSKMPSLKEVFLESNDFTKIDEIAFAQVWSQLSHVFFYGNPLNCNADMKWMYKYRLPESIQGHCANPQSLRQRSLTALEYRHDKNLGGEMNVLIFDLSFGTFHLSVLTIDVGSLCEVISAARDTRLKGEDFDKRMAAIIVMKF